MKGLKCNHIVVNNVVNNVFFNYYFYLDLELIIEEKSGNINKINDISLLGT